MKIKINGYLGKHQKQKVKPLTIQWQSLKYEIQTKSFWICKNQNKQPRWLIVSRALESLLAIA